MALPNVFANVTQLDTPDLDENFNAVGASIVIRCTATGTNTVSLTPAADQPTITSYVTGTMFTFVAAATNSGATTINVSGVGGKNVYKNAGATAIGSGDFAIGGTYTVVYNAALNAAAGGWVLINAAPTAGAAGAIQGQFKNLSVITSATVTCTVTADAVAVSDGSTSFTTLTSVSVAIAGGSTGANGIDTGSLSASQWYFVYVIYNPSTLTAAGIISLSSTSPSFASAAGYTQWARVGAIRTDGSVHFLRTIQKNYRAAYVISSGGATPTTQVVILPSASGASTIPVSSAVPSTASEIYVVAQLNAAASGSLGANSTEASTTGGIASLQVNSTAGVSQFLTGSIILQSTSIFANATGGIAVWATGWVDNL